MTHPSLPSRSSFRAALLSSNDSTTLSPEAPPPARTPTAWTVARKIRRATQDRQRQRDVAARCGDEVLCAVLAAQWASSLTRWMHTGLEADREQLERAAARCAGRFAPSIRPVEM